MFSRLMLALRYVVGSPGLRERLNDPSPRSAAEVPWANLWVAHATPWWTLPATWSGSTLSFLALAFPLAGGGAATGPGAIRTISEFSTAEGVRKRSRLPSTSSVNGIGPLLGKPSTL